MSIPAALAAANKPRMPTKRLSSLIQNNDSVTGVYVKDDAYAWLPAKIISTENMESDNKVTVAVCLPENWHQSTVLSTESNIEELEDALIGDVNVIDESGHGSGSAASSIRSTRSASSTTSSVYSPTSIRTIDLTEYDNFELPLQNIDPTTKQLLGKRDMADLPFLHEAAILYNLKERHAEMQPYTRVGDIVVAMNPFLWIHNLYSPENREVYAKNLIWKTKDEEEEEKEHDYSTFGNMYSTLGFDPHVYETSSLAYKGLAISQENQTILVSGESGAGKTETVKILMESLATVELTRPPPHQVPPEMGNKISAAETTKRVLESNPVFEAFGNAKTIRNDNSSRFGKFTQLQFDVESMESAQMHNREIPCCLLAGSRCTTYLLEKSRVVSHSEGERTYHVFYQLMAAPNEYKAQIWDHLQNCTTEDFSYLGVTETNAIDGVTDEEQWPRTLEALKVFTLEGESLQTLMRALCIVLQLGNLTFDHDPNNNVEEGGTVITSKEELDRLGKLSGIPPEDIETAMTMRVIKTAYDEVNVQLRPSVAKDSCDALAKEIYARVFDYLVGLINDYTSAEQHHEPGRTFGLISLLDIFGFERFAVNRFEQLCINYANERLQQKYVLDNFRQVQEEYIAEGIQIFDFAIVDNSKVLDLLEGRIGLIISLNEECVRPKGNDESYVYKIKVVHKEHERLIDEKLHHKAEFGIRHFAGPVTYTATKFVERNTDKLPEDLLMCAAESTNELVRSEFQGVIEMHRKNVESAVVHRKRTNKTVLEKFRLQLKDLMAKMENTSTRYIRCIKPNTTMTPKLTDHYVTMHQLECAGLVTAITISRESFPNKLDYETVRERFGLLLTEKDHKNIKGMDEKDAVNYMLSNLLLPLTEEEPDGTLIYPFACGKTRVYFRAGALEFIETKRLEYYTRFVVRVQKWVRKLQAQARYEAMREQVIKAQAFTRSRNQYVRYKNQKAATITLQCWSRSLTAKARTEQLRQNKAASQVQAVWRRRSTTKVTDFKQAATIIQRCFRNRRRKDAFTAKLAIVVEQVKMDDKLSFLQQKVYRQGAALPRSSTANLPGRVVENQLLGDIENMFDYLRKEIFMLRTKNGELKEELREAESEKRDLAANYENAESAASVTRLQVAKLTKENVALMSEAAIQKQEVVALKKELKNATVNCEESVSNIKVDYEEILQERDREIKHIKKTQKRQHRECQAEKDLLKAEIAKLQDTQAGEVLRLKDELRRTQDSHHDYLAKLMDVLETTHAARESETARITAELQSVKEEKDGHIMDLQREIEQLREMSKGQASQMQRSLESKEEEMSVMREELERNSEARTQRAEKYKEVSAKLESSLRKSGADPQDADKMRNMVHLLGNLYALEQSSQTKVNQDTVQMLDDFTVATEPNKVVEELRAKVKELEMGALLLKYEVQEQNVCQRCERRDQRRREQQRRGEQQRQASRSNMSQSSFRRRGSAAGAESSKAPKPPPRKR